VLTQLTADHVYDVKEGEGIVSQEKIKPVLPKH
jgi:hypothetical protein